MDFLRMTVRAMIRAMAARITTIRRQGITQKKRVAARAPPVVP